jgi:hypothetical protein
MARSPVPARSARLAAAILTGLLGSISLARADAAAGRAAYEKGDYARAAAEWQRAADRNDADAELGIGSLYEFGLGELPQDYKKASYWYQKAASQGSTEAEYRLALIWASGSEDLRRDLVEAYKWVLLATANKGVWGSVATDLKAQLDDVLRLDQKLEAKKRADAWKQALKALSEAPSPEAPPAPGPLTPAKGTTTSCPGWPFPTLPCTPGFPALPGPQPVQPPRIPAERPPPVAKSPLDELNDALTQIDCASLRGRASAQGAAVVSGTVPNADQKEKIVKLAGQFFPNGRPDIRVEIIPPPLCRSLSELNALRLAGLVTDDALGVRLAGRRAELREGDPIKVEVRAPAYPVNLRVDYFSLDGRVLHLWPNSQDRNIELGARETRVLGDGANSKTWNAGGAPFGTELITAIATPLPIDLGSRPPIENAGDYLRELQRVLGKSGDHGGRPNALATLLVRTGP